MKPSISPATPLVLASTSRYRAELLRRLHVPFEAIAPGVEESPAPGETPPNLAQRLARAKAQAVAAAHPDRWVLGSDQVPAFEGQVFGKPGDRATAEAQLLACSGKSVVFYTAVALVGLARVDDADATHAEAARAMAETGDFVTLKVNGIRYLFEGRLQAGNSRLRLFAGKAVNIRDPLRIAGVAVRAGFGNARGYLHGIGPVEGMEASASVRIDDPALGATYRALQLGWFWRGYWKLPWGASPSLSLRLTGGLRASELARGPAFVLLLLVPIAAIRASARLIAPRSPPHDSTCCQPVDTGSAQRFTTQLRP